MNLNAAKIIIDVLVYGINQFVGILEKLEIEPENADLTKDFFVWTKKVNLMEILFYSAFEEDDKEIFYVDRSTNPDWQILDSIMTIQEIGDQEKYEKQFNRTIKQLTLGGAIMTKGLEANNGFTQVV